MELNTTKVIFVQNKLDLLSHEKHIQIWKGSAKCFSSFCMDNRQSPNFCNKNGYHLEKKTASFITIKIDLHFVKWKKTSKSVKNLYNTFPVTAWPMFAAIISNFFPLNTVKKGFGLYKCHYIYSSIQSLFYLDLSPWSLSISVFLLCRSLSASSSLTLSTASWESLAFSTSIKSDSRDWSSRSMWSVLDEDLL